MSVKLKKPKEFKRLLAINGYSVEGFARRIGGVSASFDRYMKGQGMRPERAKKIAEALGVEMSDIFLF